MGAHLSARVQPIGVINGGAIARGRVLWPPRFSRLILAKMPMTVGL